MFRHYIKIALRNLWKYKTQTILSVLGLSVGFLCFTLSAVWLTYERSFDGFHPKGNRIYKLYSVSEKETTGTIPLEVVQQIESSYPEIEAVATLLQPMFPVPTSTPGKDLYIKRVSRSFLDMFDLDVKNYREETTPPSLIITDKAAKTLFTDQDPMGKEVTAGYDITSDDISYRISDVIAPWPANTVLEFDMLYVAEMDANMSAFVLLKEGASFQTLSEKLATYVYEDKMYGETRFELIPITNIRPYESNNSTAIIKDTSIQTFALLGLLIILCTFLNYLILYVNRIRIRRHELALRKVNGASDNSFIWLFGSEFLLVMLVPIVFVASVLGLFHFIVTTPGMYQSTNIKFENGDVFIYGLIYCLVLGALVFLISLIPLQYYKRKTLKESIAKNSGAKGEHTFYRLSILLQLIIGIGFAFCAVVSMKQVAFLKYKRIGYDFTNVSRVDYDSWNNDPVPLVGKIEALPEISEVILTSNDAVFSRTTFSMSCIEGKEESETVTVSQITVPSTYFDFYNMIFLTGEKPNPQKEIGSNTVYINRTAAREFGWTPEEAVGKRADNQVVAGVFEDIVYNPKREVEALIIKIENRVQRWSSILIRYTEGMRQEAEENIRKTIQEVYPDVEVDFTNLEELRGYYFHNENLLLLIIKIASAVCIIVSLFGVYSMILLTCTRRKKEMAIRKVNGAGVGTIFYSLLKEPFILTIIAAFIAFPIAHYWMQRWIEGYIKQVEISWWLYPLVFAGVLVVVVLTIFFQVWRVASQNPAEVLKAE